MVQKNRLKVLFRDKYKIEIKSHFDANIAALAIDKSVCKLVPASGGLSNWCPASVIGPEPTSNFLKAFQSWIKNWNLEKGFEAKGMILHSILSSSDWLSQSEADSDI